jgi:hypothetical protein
MIAGTPGQGGATWAILQYLLGLQALGCDVTFVEPVDDPERPDRIAWCRMVLGDAGLGDRWCLVGPDGATTGMDRAGLIVAAHRADILLNVAGMLTDRDVLDRIDTRVYLDLDPCFVQMWHDEGIDMHLDAHTHFVTMADSIGSNLSPIPTCGRTWMPTLPPVVLHAWEPVADTVHDAFTTVAHWRSYGSVHRGGATFGQKAHAFRPIIDLPRRVPDRFALALAIHPDEGSDLAALDAHGWELVDPGTCSSTPNAYRDFVRGSRAELGVAKHGYIASNSGWFSDRSACYLASGRPVVAQDTGFGRRLPTGAGLFAFSDVDGFAIAAEAIGRDPCGQRRAARAVAEEHLAADRVLTSLLERVA